MINLSKIAQYYIQKRITGEENPQNTISKTNAIVCHDVKESLQWRWNGNVCVGCPLSLRLATLVWRESRRVNSCCCLWCTWRGPSYNFLIISQCGITYFPGGNAFVLWNNDGGTTFAIRNLYWGVATYVWVVHVQYDASQLWFDFPAGWISFECPLTCM